MVFEFVRHGLRGAGILLKASLQSLFTETSFFRTNHEKRVTSWRSF